jgi:hypothetical protein
MSALATDAPPPSADVAEDDAAETPNFSFRFQNRRFQAWTQEDSQGPMVYLACEIGHLPYSAENREGRRTSLMILSGAGSILSARLMLTDFHKISLLTAIKITDAKDLRGVVSAAAASVVSSLPLIELMELSVTPATAQK